MRSMSLSGLQKLALSKRISPVAAVVLLAFSSSSAQADLAAWEAYIAPPDWLDAYDAPLDPDGMIPRYCLWTTSEECGTALPSFEPTQEPSPTIPRHCLWTTSVECGNALTEAMEFAVEAVQEIPPRCLWTTSVGCGTALPPEDELAISVETVDFCWKYYPVCVATPAKPTKAFIVEDIIIEAEPEPVDSGVGEIPSTDDVESPHTPQHQDDHGALMQAVAQELHDLITTGVGADPSGEDEAAPSSAPASTPTSPLQAQNDGNETVKPAAVQNPFTHTPLGQPLRAGFQPVGADTAAGPAGAYFGLTRINRDLSPRMHGGFDEGLAFGRVFGGQDIVFHGDFDMHVRAVVPSQDHPRYGGIVEMVGKDEFGNVIMSGYVHLMEVFVWEGQRVTKNDLIGRGYGVGSIFSEEGAGLPHVHWKLEVNGVRVDPLQPLYDVIDPTRPFVPLASSQ